MLVVRSTTKVRDPVRVAGYQIRGVRFECDAPAIAAQRRMIARAVCLRPLTRDADALIARRISAGGHRRARDECDNRDNAAKHSVPIRMKDSHCRNAERQLVLFRPEIHNVVKHCPRRSRCALRQRIRVACAMEYCVGCHSETLRLCPANVSTFMIIQHSAPGQGMSRSMLKFAGGSGDIITPTRF